MWMELVVGIRGIRKFNAALTPASGEVTLENTVAKSRKGAALSSKTPWTTVREPTLTFCEECGL